MMPFPPNPWANRALSTWTGSTSDATFVQTCRNVWTVKFSPDLIGSYDRAGRKYGGVPCSQDVVRYVLRGQTAPRSIVWDDGAITFEELR